MNLWTYTLRELQRRPGRTALTFLGIALGLAVIVATRLTIQTAQGAYRDMAEGLAGRPALEVTGPGQGGFDGGFAPTLLSVRGVSAVVPCVDGVVALAGDRGSVSARILGVNPDRASPDWAAPTGQPLGPDEALLDGGLAATLGLAPGQTLRLWGPAGPAELRLAGTFASRLAGLGGLLVVPLASGRRLLNLPDRVSRLEVVLAEEADPARTQAEVARRLPTGLTVQPPGSREALGRATLLSAEQGLSALGAAALVAAAFVILNTFLLTLGERRAQLATLRALGATPGQVTSLLLREAALLGLAGTVAGCVAGAGLAAVMLGIVGQFLGVALPGLQLTIGPFLLAGVLGPVTALAAVLLPAYCAGRRPPLAELIPQRGRADGPAQRWPAWLGVLLLTVGGGLGVGLCRGWFSAAAGETLFPLTLALLLAGGAAALAALARSLLRLAEGLPLGLALDMACRQLRRHHTRTALTAGVLFLSLAVAIAFGNSIRGVVGDLRSWYGRTIVADFLVRGSMTDTAFTLAAPIPESLAEEIQRCGPVAAVGKIAFVPARVNGDAALVLARTFAHGRPLALDLQDGDEAGVLRGLLRGEVVLGTGLAERLGLRTGDTVTLATPRGPKVLRVAGTAREYAVGGQALYLEWETARALLDVPGAHAFLVSARPEDVAALGPALRAFCARRGLMLQSHADLGDLVDGLAGRVTGVLWALLGLAFVVASLGILNTLLMNVRDQTRAFGMLRAVGARRGCVYRLVLAQAGLLWGVSLVPGALTGLALAYLINRAGTSAAVPPIPFRVDALVLVGACGLALLTALLAALLPARRAARLAIVRAIQHG